MSFFEKLKMENDKAVEEPEEAEEASTEEAAPEEPEETPEIKEGKKSRKKAKVKEKPVMTKAASEEPPKSKIKKAGWFDQEGQLTVDVYQADDELVIQSAVGGVRSEDLDIVIEKDMVKIKGRREKPEGDRNQNYFYQECYWGPFSREIILPAEIDAARSEALMKEGILTIRLPIIEHEKKKKLSVRTN